jgi:hypothetical protein
LRRAAQRVVELTEMLLLSLTPVVAGRTGPLKFAISIVGPTIDEARHVVEQIVSQVQGLLPTRSSSARRSSRVRPGAPLAPWWTEAGPIAILLGSRPCWGSRREAVPKVA